MAFRRVGDIVVHHDDAPAGDTRLPTLVLANSLGTDLRVWDALVPHLRHGFRLVRYDKRGHGLTDLTPGPYAMDGLARDLAGLLDALGTGPVIVCGLSIGGMIAQALAASRPDLVRGLVLMCTAHKIGTAETWQQRIEAVRSPRGIDGIADAVLERWFGRAFREGRPEDLAGWRNMLTRTPVEGYAACCAAIRDADLTEAARALRAPTLCIAGEEDGATPPALVRELAGLVAGSRYVEVRGAGHLPCVQEPAVVAGAILRFVEEAGVA
jgi:3-oxoadipate enol-lactonase